jgi:hypothetical protein
VVDGFVLPMTITRAFESGNVMPVPLMFPERSETR